MVIWQWLTTIRLFPALSCRQARRRRSQPVVPLSEGDTRRSAEADSQVTRISPASLCRESKPLPGGGDDSVTVSPTDSRGDGTWGTFFHDVIHPQPANLSRPQTWRDWGTKTYSPTLKQA